MATYRIIKTLHLLCIFSGISALTLAALKIISGQSTATELSIAESIFMSSVTLGFISGAIVLISNRARRNISTSAELTLGELVLMASGSSATSACISASSIVIALLTLIVYGGPRSYDHHALPDEARFLYSAAIVLFPVFLLSAESKNIMLKIKSN